MANPDRRDPWLDIPLSDYEGHMSADSVAQLSVLGSLFAEVLAECRPESVAILGVAGGNGLEHVDPLVTRRVVGVDLNRSYLEAVRRRHGVRLHLELHRLDLATEKLELEPVHLVHAALIFEHAGTDRCLENAIALVAPDGALSVVLQLPGSAPDVAATPFLSIQTLARNFSIIDPGAFTSLLETRGFRLRAQTTRPLPGGKAFWMGIFRRTSDRF